MLLQHNQQQTKLLLVVVGLLMEGTTKWRF